MKHAYPSNDHVKIYTDWKCCVGIFSIENHFFKRIFLFLHWETDNFGRFHSKISGDLLVEEFFEHTRQHRHR